MGHIQKRGTNRWTARWIDDRAKERAKSFSRRSDAQRFLTEIERSLQQGMYVDLADRTTFGDYAERWRAAQPHRPSTARATTKILARALPAFGDRRLSAIRSSDVQGWLTGLVVRDGLAPSTARVTFQTVRAIFNAAVRDRMIASSPCEGVAQPKLPRARVEPISRDQVESLIEAFDPRYRAMIVLAAGSGLRAGELFGLQVADVDFLRRTVAVTRQIQEVGGHLHIGEPKTDSSHRVVPIPSVVVDALATHLAADRPSSANWVFRSPSGGPIRRTNFMRSYWNPAARAAGILSGTGLHALRHFYASVLISGGLSVKVVSERLGHTNAAMTLNTYAHLFPDDEDQTRTVVQQALTLGVTDTSRTGQKSETDGPLDSRGSFAVAGVGFEPT